MIKRIAPPLLLALFIINEVKCQSGDECKYFSALFYLRTNEVINEKIKGAFPTLTNKKNRYIEFSISDEIRFFGITLFKTDSIIRNLGIDSTLLISDILYHNKYFFEPVKSSFLSKLKEQFALDKVRFYLSFAKPVNDFLIAEIEIVDPLTHPNMGKAMQILFKFDSTGIISHCTYAWIAYR